MSQVARLSAGVRFIRTLVPPSKIYANDRAVAAPGAERRNAKMPIWYRPLCHPNVPGLVALEMRELHSSAIAFSSSISRRGCRDHARVVVVAREVHLPTSTAHTPRQKSPRFTTTFHTVCNFCIWTMPIHSAPLPAPPWRIRPAPAGSGLPLLSDPVPQSDRGRTRAVVGAGGRVRRGHAQVARRSRICRPQQISFDMPGAPQPGVVRSQCPIAEAEKEYLASLKLDPDFTPGID